MKQCFGYVRVSTTKQSDGVSLDEQKAAIEEFASRKDLAISKWWEETETAAKRGRPVFNEMVSALRRKKADGLIIHKIDRSARNFHDWATISDLADDGIAIHIATESFDFNTYGGRMAADFTAVVSANYIRNLKHEIHKGQRGQLKRGLLPWGAPIGYLNNGKGKFKTPDPKRAPYIKLAFELYSTGEYSLKSLHAELKQRGLRNRAGKPLSLCGLETLLNNAFYCGLIHIKKWGETFKGGHEPLISVATFRRVQDIKSDKSGKKVTKHRHTYRGLFRCADCGSAMIPELQKGHVYYRCQNSDCETKSVREEVLEAAITHCLQHAQIKSADVERAKHKIEKVVREYREQRVDDTVALQLGMLNEKLERLTDALIDRLIDKKAFERRKAALMMEQTALEERAARNRSFARKAAEVRSVLELTKSVASTYLLGNRQDRRAIAKNTTSNRTVRGKEAYVEPSNWLVEVKNAIGILSCAHAPDTSRTLIENFSDLELEI